MLWNGCYYILEYKHDIQIVAIDKLSTTVLSSVANTIILNLEHFSTIDMHEVSRNPTYTENANSNKLTDQT